MGRFQPPRSGGQHSSSWSIRPPSPYDPRVVSVGLPGILPGGTIARHLSFRPAGGRMITSGCARSNRIRRATPPGWLPTTVRRGRSLMAGSWHGRGGTLLYPHRRARHAPAGTPCTEVPHSGYVPLSPAWSLGNLDDRDASGDLRLVRVHREQHAAEH